MAQRGEPEKIVDIDSEYLSGKRQPYQEDISELDEVDLEAATPGQDINWLEDVELLEEEGTPAVFDRYSNSFIRIYFKIPQGRENEIARKVLVKHLQSGNSYGIGNRPATDLLRPWGLTPIAVARWRPAGHLRHTRLRSDRMNAHSMARSRHA